MRTTQHTSRGFTLIELVLVMLIIGLLLAVVAPSLGGMFRKSRLDHAARTVTAMLKEARVRAVAEARPHRLVIDTDDNRCWIEVQTAEGFQRPESTLGEIVELGEDLLIELEGGTTDGNLLIVRVEPDGIGELAVITLERERTGSENSGRQTDNRALSVYCKSPTEPYIVGKAMELVDLESEADDVDVDY